MILYNNVIVSMERIFRIPIQNRNWVHFNSTSRADLEIILGAYYRIRIKEASKITGYNKESAIALGGVWRYGDALCPGVLFEIKDYYGISYDMTLSKLLPATNTMGHRSSL